MTLMVSEDKAVPTGWKLLEKSDAECAACPRIRPPRVGTGWLWKLRPQATGGLSGRMELSCGSAHQNP